MAQLSATEKHYLGDGVYGEADDFGCLILDYPLSTGGALVIDVDDGDPEYSGKRLDRESIARGMQVMSEQYPGHFARFLTETGDANTGDVFLQCCLFGEVIFG